MFGRPPRSVPLHEIQAVVQSHWHDRDTLESLARDLARRPESSAPLVLGAIRARLRDLATQSPDSARLARELEEERHRTRRAQDEIKVLRAKLATASASRASQEELADLRRQLDNAGRTSPQDSARRQVPAGCVSQDSAAAYSELHLTPDVPDDLLESLRHAYQKHYHPDRAGAGGRTDRFQAVQQAFDTIRRERGLR